MWVSIILKKKQETILFTGSFIREPELFKELFSSASSFSEKTKNMIYAGALVKDPELFFSQLEHLLSDEKTIE